MARSTGPTPMCPQYRFMPRSATNRNVADDNKPLRTFLNRQDGELIGDRLLSKRKNGDFRILVSAVPDGVDASVVWKRDVDEQHVGNGVFRWIGLDIATECDDVEAVDVFQPK